MQKGSKITAACRCSTSFQKFTLMFNKAIACNNISTYIDSLGQVIKLHSYSRSVDVHSVTLLFSQKFLITTEIYEETMLSKKFYNIFSVQMVVCPQYVFLWNYYGTFVCKYITFLALTKPGNTDSEVRE